MRLLILALDHASQPHSDNAAVQKQTWGRNIPDWATVAWVRGRKDATEAGLSASNDLVVPVDDTYPNIFEKTVAAMRFFGTQRFDFVIRTNSSSYFMFNQLKRLLEQLNSRRVYAGPPGRWSGLWGVDELDVLYASGAFTLLSGDVAALIRESKTGDYAGLFDDVAIGLTMFRAGVPLQPLQRLDLTDGDVLRAAPYFRCKHWYQSEVTRKRMREIHSAVESSNAAELEYLLRAHDFAEAKRCLDYRGLTRRSLRHDLSLIKRRKLDMKSRVESFLHC